MLTESSSKVERALTSDIEAIPQMQDKNPNEELEKLRASCKALDQELSMLAYAISHDLEQPLRHIMAFSKLLARKTMNHEDADIQKYANFVQTSGETLEARIDSILSFSRLSKHEIHLESINAGTIVQKLALEAQRDLNLKHTHFELQPLPILQTDVFLFTRIMEELLNNAFYFSSRETKPSVKVYAATMEGEVVITVQDNGVGIGEKPLERLVKLFQKREIENFPTDPSKVGVGLSMVQRAVNLLQATLTHSKADQGETCFHVTFPRPT